MKLYEVLWKIAGQLLIILGIIDILAVRMWTTGLSITWPEEAFELIPPFFGYIGCGIILIAGIIALSGWFWRKYPTVITLYVFAFLSSFVSILICYSTENTMALRTAIVAVSIAVMIFTMLTIFTRKAIS